MVFVQWGFRNKSLRETSHTNTRLTTSKLGLAFFVNEHIGGIWTRTSGPTSWVDTWINWWVNVYSWKSRLTTRRARKTWFSRIELNSPCWCRTNRRVGLCIKKSESSHIIESHHDELSKLNKHSLWVLQCSRAQTAPGIEWCMGLSRHMSPTRHHSK